MNSYLADFYAPSNQHVVRAKLRTVTKMIEQWGHAPFPITAEKIHCLGASLKLGGYKSAATYLSAYKVEAERLDNVISTAMTRAIKDATRSCTRGLGGPVKAKALPFSELGCLPGGREPWVVNGPVCPRNAIVLGAWFLAREVELSGSRAASLSLVPEDLHGRPRVSWSLPASKNDQAAEGVTRTHGCSCTSLPSPSCPAHAAWDQLIALKSLFPHLWQGSCPLAALPLFPDAAGRACSKEAMTATIMKAAEFLKVPIAAPDGSERVSGHSLRATGAQGLAELGVDVWAIQLLGRWGSQAVVGYVREASLKSSAEWARRAAQSRTIEQIAEQIVVGPGVGPVVAAEVRDQAARLDEVVKGCCDKEVQTEVVEAIAVEVMAARAPQPEDLTLAFSATGLAHAVLAGPPEFPLDACMSVCGWRFGRSSGSASLAPFSALPKCYKLLCSKCFSGRREAMKCEAARGAGQMGG